MDTQFLESFIAVVENGSIAAAARALDVTPNAIAQRIKVLEAELGLRLVSRDGRTVGPTEAGAAIFERARGIVRDTAALKSAALRSRGADREIKLGAISSAVTGILPDVLKHIAERHLDIKINVVPGTSSQLCRTLLDGQIDAAIVVEPNRAVMRHCGWQLLRTEDLILLAHNSTQGISASSLILTQPYIRYRRDDCGRLADEYLRHLGIQPKMIFELDGLDAIANMVARGLGISIVPNWAQTDAGSFALVRHTLPDTSLSRKIGLLWANNSHRIRPLQKVLYRATKGANSMSAQNDHD